VTVETLTVGQLRQRLKDLEFLVGPIDALPIQLICGAVTWPVLQVWYERRHSEQPPSICIGDDPR
jgi:hypothetical protein